MKYDDNFLAMSVLKVVAECCQDQPNQIVMWSRFDMKWPHNKFSPDSAIARDKGEKIAKERGWIRENLSPKGYFLTDIGLKVLREKYVDF